MSLVVHRKMEIIKMMELKFKEVGSEYSLKMEENESIRIKPFVTWDEFSAIYNLVLAQDNSFMRHYAKVVEFAKACTNIDFDGMENDEIYDICAELGLIEEFRIMIEEFSDLDKMIDRDESVYNVIKEVSDGLLPQLNVAMEKLGDGSGFIEKIKGVMSGVNKKSD